MAEYFSILFSEYPTFVSFLLMIPAFSSYESWYGRSYVNPFKNNSGASLVAQTLKNLPAMQETWVRSLGWEDPLEKGMAAHSSILAWRIPMDRGTFIREFF